MDKVKVAERHNGVL